MFLKQPFKMWSMTKCSIQNDISPAKNTNVSLPSVSLCLERVMMTSNSERLAKWLDLPLVLSDTDERRRRRAPPPQPPEELGRPNKVICPLWVSIDPHNPMMLRLWTWTGVIRRKMI